MDKWTVIWMDGWMRSRAAQDSHVNSEVITKVHEAKTVCFLSTLVSPEFSTVPDTEEVLGRYHPNTNSVLKQHFPKPAS